MAPFRQGGRLNRSGRTQVDHDVFEGLPIRQWRAAESLVGPPPEAPPAADKSPFPELPMPRDSHLLPEHSQQLLRAARADRVSKPAAASADEEKENAEEEENKEETFRGFTVKKFTKVPRHLEEPEPEYLAKRRKGLTSAHSVYNTIVAGGPTTQAPPMRKTKVRKEDKDGNSHVYEVLVPEGQTVEGEVKEEEAVAVEPIPAALPGTVVEGVGVVNQDGVVVASDLIQPTPARRRPPPPKRKKKPSGPGRGKKKVLFAEGEGAGTTPGGTPSDSLAVASVRTEGTPRSGAPSDGDTPMGDAADEDEEGEEEEGEEGEEGDDDEGSEEGELAGTPAPSKGQEQAQEEQQPDPSATAETAPITISPPADQPEASEMKMDLDLVVPSEEPAPAPSPSPAPIPTPAMLVTSVEPTEGASSALEAPSHLEHRVSNSPREPSNDATQDQQVPINPPASQKSPAAESPQPPSTEVPLPPAEAEEEVQPAAEPAEPTVQAESTVSFEASAPAESSETTLPTESAEQPNPPAESTETVEPAKSTEPAEPTEPTEPAKLTEVTEPTEPTEPVEPVEPSGPSEPSEPTKPAEPIVSASEPADSAAPEETDLLGSLERHLEAESGGK